MEIILASYNDGKAREIEKILCPIKVVSLRALGVEIDFDAVEDGETYRENAIKKARAAAEKVNGVLVADDSGLEVAALGGGPGVNSARYGAPGASSDGDRCRLLLKELSGVEGADRSARFVCVVAARFPDGTELFFEGDCPGVISSEMKGEGGFGYDPVFFLPDRGLSMAEISREEKNMISHRFKAFSKLKAALEQL